MHPDTFAVYTGTGEDNLHALLKHFKMDLKPIVSAFKACKKYTSTHEGNEYNFLCKKDGRWAIVYFLPSTSRDVHMHSAALTRMFPWIRVKEHSDFIKEWDKS